MKSRLRKQQHEHEKEQSNQAIMLKELQQMVSVERMIKEQFENQVKSNNNGFIQKIHKFDVMIAVEL